VIPTLALLAIWLLFVVLVPKRGFGTIAQRLRQVEGGDRAFVFGAPARLGVSVPALVGGEMAALVELGLPLYLRAWRAESLCHRASELAEANRELPPAPKASPIKVRTYTIPPMAWRREWDATLAERVERTSAAPGPVTQAAAVLTARTLGTFQLLDGGDDLAPELLSHSVLCFLWLYLLSHAVVHPGAPIHRDMLADEGSPGLDREQQRTRLRSRLRDLLDLPAALAARIEVSGEWVQFRLESTDLDVVSVRRAADEWDRSVGLLPDEGVVAVEARMADYAGEYLPIWDELERRITGGRGAGGELVRNVRLSAEHAYGRLLLRLAQHHGARRDFPRAIPLWEEVLRRNPEREDVVAQLLDAYRQTGQVDQARRLGTAHSLGGKKVE
jgi:hypothetical protein